VLLFCKETPSFLWPKRKVEVENLAQLLQVGLLEHQLFPVFVGRHGVSSWSDYGCHASGYPSLPKHERTLRLLGKLRKKTELIEALF